MRDLIENLRYVRAQTDFAGSSSSTPERRRLCAAFVTDSPSPTDLRRLGFDKPARRIDLDFTDNGKNSRRTLLLALPVDSETPPHAKLEEAPSVYSVRRNLPALITASPAQYRNRIVTRIPAETITALKITDLETGKVLFALPAPAVAPVPVSAPAAAAAGAPVPAPVVAAANAAAATPVSPLLANLSPAERRHATTLLEALAELRAATYLETPFAKNFTFKHPGFEKKFPWRYHLQITLRPPNTTTDEQSEFFLTKRLDGITQIAGAPAQSATFKIPQPLIDALFPLTFVKHQSQEIPKIPQPADIPAAPTPPSLTPAKKN
jgi:hypothetical protein